MAALEKRLRAFLACGLPASAAATLENHVAALRKQFPHSALHWIPSRNWHVTLRFFGAIDDERVDVLQAALQAVARTARPVEARLGGVLLFPETGRARVIALHVVAGDAFDRLAIALDEAIGDVREHPFKAHLTLVRLHRPGLVMRERVAEACAAIEHERIACRFDRMALFRSDVTAAGRKYTPVFELPFEDRQDERPS